MQSRRILLLTYIQDCYIIPLLNRWKGHQMTRKHFQIIADALVEANATIEQVKIIAKQLKATNPRFNTDRFILAAMNWE